MSFGFALALPYIMKAPASTPVQGPLSHTLLQIGLTTPAA